MIAEDTRKRQRAHTTTGSSNRAGVWRLDGVVVKCLAVRRRSLREERRKSSRAPGARRFGGTFSLNANIGTHLAEGCFASPSELIYEPRRLQVSGALCLHLR